MIIQGLRKKGEYYDSVTLMMAAKKLNELPGVLDSAIVMGTQENRAILQASGLMIADFAASGDTDLLIAVKAESQKSLDAALAEVNAILKSVRQTSKANSESLPRTLHAALQALPEANLAMISVAGRYAGNEAMKALQHGLNVMLFSDNVPIEQEITLKQFAVEHDLLVMGPDCGTAIINGIPLAFANVVNRGNIGIVAAAGTGLQEVSCLISNSDAGISQAIGTGGRDVKQQVGGLMFIQSLRLLARDPSTKVILLVSKPPHPDVLKKIASEVISIRKPIVAAFLGAEPDTIRQGRMIPAASLEEAAILAVALSKGLSSDVNVQALTKRREDLKLVAKALWPKLASTQQYLRGLFSGGTFCYEAQLLLKDNLSPIHSNAPTGSSVKLENSLTSQGHTIIDLGEDEFTVGRPHPMIDYSLRNKRIIQEAEDPATAVILLDIVLGYGSNPDPLAEIVPTIRKVRELTAPQKRMVPIVCSVTGTDNDPQNRSVVTRGLSENGVFVMESNAAASILSGYICSKH